MKDIGKINQRVTNLERVTSLSLLEKNTEQKQILDADGLDRFKSGFLVDNFRGHKIGCCSPRLSSAYRYTKWSIKTYALYSVL